MRQVLFATLMLALAAMASGCKVCDGWKHGCFGGGQAGCGHGGCSQGGCPDGACGEVDGHPSPYEPLYHGRGHAPVQRSGLLGHLQAAGMASDPGIGHGGHLGRGGRLGMNGAGMDGAGMNGAGANGMANVSPTPPASAGAVSYPYYTTRGPRDFLAPNPRGIGP